MRGVMLRLPGSITVSSSVNGQLLPISSVETEKKQVALTFDAVEGNGDTAQILETLKRHDVHATFFLTGGWAAGLACMKKCKVIDRSIDFALLGLLDIFM